jgi:hypothetical protein
MELKGAVKYFGGVVEAMVGYRVVDAATGSVSYATASLMLGTAQAAQPASCSERDHSCVDASITPGAYGFHMHGCMQQ